MALKLRTRTNFPALVTVQSPLALEKEGLSYDFSLDIDAIRENFDSIYAPVRTGEYLENAVAAGSAVSVTSATAKTIAQIPLTPGEWDVSALLNGLTTNASTSITGYGGSLSLVDNTLDTSAGRFSQVRCGAFVPGNSATVGVPFPSMKFVAETNTTVYLIAYMTFSVSTMSAYGIIRARLINPFDQPS